MALKARPAMHTAGIVHVNGSQFCRDCGVCLRLPDAPLPPHKRGEKVARTIPCRPPRAPFFDQTNY